MRGWQNTSFVSAWEPGHTPRMLLSSTLGFSALLGSLHVSECIVGCRWYIGARVGRAQAPLFARDERRNREEIDRVSASVDALQTTIHCAQRGIHALVCTKPVMNSFTHMRSEGDWVWQIPCEQATVRDRRFISSAV